MLRTGDGSITIAVAVGKRWETHSDGRGLYEESDEVEAELAARCEGDTGGDHEHDDRETLVGLVDTEGPRDEKNCYRDERLGVASLINSPLDRYMQVNTP